MVRTVGLAFLSLSLVAGVASADQRYSPQPINWRPNNWGPGFSAPEIDPASLMSGLTLLAGGLVVLRGGRGKKNE